MNAFKIESFIEKPDITTAQDFVDSGNYCWNSGMFMFKASAIINELKEFVPDIVEQCSKAVKQGVKDLDFFRLDQEIFEKTASNSIDYAVMEKTKKGVMLPYE